MLTVGIIALVFINHSFPDIPQVYAEITFVVLLGKTGQAFAENMKNTPLTESVFSFPQTGETHLSFLLLEKALVNMYKRRLAQNRLPGKY